MRHNQHVIDRMMITYNYLWEIYKGHSLKREHGGFANTGTTERFACRLQINELNNAINEELKII